MTLTPERKLLELSTEYTERRATVGTVHDEGGRSLDDIAVEYAETLKHVLS